MNSYRGPFLSGIVLGVGIGLLLGHFFIIKQEPVRGSFGAFEVPPQSSGSAYFEEGLFSASELGSETGFESVSEFEEIDEEHPLKNALAIDSSPAPLQKITSELVPTPPKTGLSEPAPVPVQEASPLSKNSVDEYMTIRAIVDLELSHLPQDKRDVWFEALKDVRKEDVAGILRMWKLLGGPIPGAPGGDGFASSPAIPIAPGEATTPAAPAEESPSSASTNGDEQLLALEKEARRIARENERMRDTPGYVTRSAVLHQNAEGVWSLKTQWKHFSERRVKTAFPLDVAIAGPGFFQVMDESGKKYLTRHGHFALSDDARLCLRVDDQMLPVVPEVRFPDDFESTLSSDEELQNKIIDINEEGRISVLARKGDSTVVVAELGKIEVFLPLSSSDLTPEANGLWTLRDFRESRLMSAPISERFPTYLLSGYLELPAATGDF